jgi:uracil-DNA glycosylase
MSRLHEVVTRKVQGCTDCYLHEGCNAPIPFEGRVGARYLFIGEAPTRTDDELGRPMIGGAGKMLREKVRKSGLFTREVAYTNIIRCWPGEMKGKKRRPVKVSSEMAEACRVNLMLEMKAVNASVVGLLGAVALNTFRPDFKVTKHWGVPFMIDVGVVGVGLVHPDGALKSKELEHQLAAGVEIVKRLGKGGESGMFKNWPSTCIVCGFSGYMADSMGVFYCEEHAWSVDQWRGNNGKQRMVV